MNTFTQSIPKDWRISRWGHVCEKIQDGTHFSPTTDSTEEFKYLTSRNIRFGRVDLAQIQYIDKKQHNEIYKGCPVKKGDVLLTKDGANTGNAAVNPLSEEFSLLSSVAFMRPHSGELSPLFLLQTILSEHGQRMIKDAMSGLAITRITLEIIKEFPIALPPKPEQAKIAEILSTVDRAIEQTEALIAKQQRLKTGLMQNLLTRGIDEHGNLRSERTHPFKDSPLGRIPVEWEAKSIEEMMNDGTVSDVQDGNHGELHPKSRDFVDEGIPFVMASDIAEGVINIERAKKITNAQYQTLRIGFSQPGDVLLSHKASIGFVALVPEEIPSIMLTPQVTYYRIGNMNALFPEFLTQIFRGPQFQNQLKGLAKQSTRDYIGILAQEKLWVAFPPTLDEQKAICALLDLQDTEAIHAQRTLAKLRALKTALMQDLLNGRKRVTALLDETEAGT